ncbi:Superoxide dismutase [Mn], mitochondrial [Pestalotiopsis sp. IQ-011]
MNSTTTTNSSAAELLSGILSDPTAAAYKIIAALAAAYVGYKLFFAASKPLYFLPVWVPLEIALATYLASAGGWGRRIYSFFRRYDGSLFGLSRSHQVIIDLPNADRFMTQSGHSLEHVPAHLTLMVRVFGSDDSPEFVQKVNATIKPLISVVEKEFLSEAASTAALERGGVVQKMSSLVTFTDNKDDMQVWERGANVKLIQSDSSGQPGAVEVDLMGIIRDFGATIAIPVLYGRDFLERNPGLLEDFWKFDNDAFPILMVGVPTWAPFKMLRDGLEARERMNKALYGLYRRIDQYQKGEPVDFGADMSDVGAALGRNLVYEKYDISFQHRADMDLPFLWGQNGNTQPLLFWFILYVYSTPGMADRLREEMAPYVSLSAKNGGFEIESVDIAALNRECPLSKAAMFETFRLGSEATSIRRVSKPMTVPDGAHTHHLQAGSFISTAWSTSQSDPSVYPEPEKFIPERFLEFDAETGRKAARYGRLRPWAVGGGSCKGRTFAEKEILTIAACMLCVWEIEPAGGKWQIPAMIPGTGAKRPVNDVRVIFKRRVPK